MTNLLPQTEQVVIKKEYKYRRAVVAALVLVVAIAVSAGFLFPSLILSNIKLKIVSGAAESARISNEKQIKENASSFLIEETKGKIALLKTQGPESSVVDIIESITKDKSSDIRIKEISYEKGHGLDGRIVISGLSKNRESLTGFLNQMREAGVFKSVDLPVSNFAKDKDISFSMQILGTF